MNSATRLGLTALLLSLLAWPCQANDPNDPNIPDPNQPSVIFVGPPQLISDMLTDRFSIDIGINQNDDPFLLWDGTGTVNVFTLTNEVMLLGETGLFPPTSPDGLPIEEEFTSFASSVSCFPNNQGACNLEVGLFSLNEKQIAGEWLDTDAPYPDEDSFVYFRLVLGRDVGLPPLTLTQTNFPVAGVTMEARFVGVNDPEMLSFQVYALSLCLGDADSDLDVDLSDLAIVLANFGRAPAAPEEGDLNGDGKVDLQDLAIVLAAFGENC